MNKSNSSRLYNLIESFKIMYRAFKGSLIYKKAIKKGIIEKKLSERIMLAVTEVNGCSICSYAHTKMALDSGMSGEEIKELLCGSLDNIPSDDIQAIMFAQHSAEMRGYPANSAKKALIKCYGFEKSEAIMSVINFIMLGNTYGIPFGSFISRFSKKTNSQIDSRSNPFYEVLMLISLVIFIPIALIFSIISRLLKRPIFSISKN